MWHPIMEISYLIIQPEYSQTWCNEFAKANTGNPIDGLQLVEEIDSYISKTYIIVKKERKPQSSFLYSKHNLLTLLRLYKRMIGRLEPWRIFTAPLVSPYV